jgi:hypothetical protein
MNIDSPNRRRKISTCLLVKQHHKRMKKSLLHIPPVWILSILLPLPAIIFWRSNYGRTMALCLFFIGCGSLVAYAFLEATGQEVAGAVEHPKQIWQSLMRTLSMTLIAAFAVFSLLLLFLSDTRDLVAVTLAFLILIPSLCVVPYFTLLTRKPFAAVVFTLCAVFCMKLLGCVVVVVIYGWHADAHDPPYTDMPWTHPNLLVWLFWLFTAILSCSLYFFGKRRFCRVYGCAA